MTYSLSKNCTKNYYNRTLTVQVIIEDVVTWIFWDTVTSFALLECEYIRKIYNNRKNNPNRLLWCH